MARRHRLTFVFGTLTVGSLVAVIISATQRRWDAAGAFATILAGLVAADVVIWQGYLIKRQLAFSTYLELDKEWNSAEMIHARQKVHAPGSDDWDHSRLEGILEFFEKLASMFTISGELSFIYESTLGWYAAQYFLFARKHDQIQYLRDFWQDHLYQDLEEFYDFYVRSEAGRNPGAQRDWEAKRLTTEESFWEQERKD